jgi:hypothetical protein
MWRLVFALLLAACSTSKPMSGDGGGPGGPGDLATGSSVDLLNRSIVGIACGPMACTATLELCCTADSGLSGTCQNAKTGCGATAFQCDGPEDCEPANHECCIQGGLAACRQPGYCQSAQINGTLMCHTNADCPPGQNCCSPGSMSTASGSPYKLCLVQACPP